MIENRYMKNWTIISLLGIWMLFVVAPVQAQGEREDVSKYRETVDFSLPRVAIPTNNGGGFNTQPVDIQMLPPDYIFSPQHVGPNDSIDSDADPNTGLTQTFNLPPGVTKNDIDAGIVQSDGT